MEQWRKLLCFKVFGENKSDCEMFKCQLKLYVSFRQHSRPHDVKSDGEYVAVVDISIWEDKSHKMKFFFQFSTSASCKWCFCSLVAFVVMWIAVRGPQNNRNSSTDETKEISFVNCWKALRWLKRKAGSEAYLYRDDGMNHLKVINLKINRERRRGETKERKKWEEICISLSFQFE